MGVICTDLNKVYNDNQLVINYLPNLIKVGRLGHSWGDMAITYSLQIRVSGIACYGGITCNDFSHCKAPLSQEIILDTKVYQAQFKLLFLYYVR